MRENYINKCSSLVRLQNLKSGKMLKCFRVDNLSTEVALKEVAYQNGKGNT